MKTLLCGAENPGRAFDYERASAGLHEASSDPHPEVAGIGSLVAFGFERANVHHPVQHVESVARFSGAPHAEGLFE